ncbi:MAG: hypothetical protein Q4Q17_02885 [Tissierellia bacterium]|nr:hypothetical protein [Tissierellia bacterium]
MTECKFREALELNPVGLDIVYYPKLNVFRGQENVDLVVKHYRFRSGKK